MRKAIVMVEKRTPAPSTAPANENVGEHRQPLVSGNCHRYMLARGDQLAFAAEVVRFGFAPDDFTLDVERLPGKRSAHSTAPTFSVRVANVQNRRALTYLGGPSRAWVAEFLEDLIAGVFGQPETPGPPLGLA
jgi:hypothetical protein